MMGVDGLGGGEDAHHPSGTTIQNTEHSNAETNSRAAAQGERTRTAATAPANPATANVAQTAGLPPAK